MNKLSLVIVFLLPSVACEDLRGAEWLAISGEKLCAWGGCEEAIDSSMLKNPLRGLIAEGLAMLKAKEYAKSFKTFMSPEEYKKVNENGAFEQITAAMASEVGPQLVELFERLKNLQPFDGQERHLHPAGQSPQWTEYLSVSAHRRSVVRQ